MERALELPWPPGFGIKHRHCTGRLSLGERYSFVGCQTPRTTKPGSPGSHPNQGGIRYANRNWINLNRGTTDLGHDDVIQADSDMQVIYEEGQMVEQLHLPLEKMELLEVETAVSGATPTLFHQHSGVSDSSTDGGTVEKIRKPSIQSRAFLVQEDSKKAMGRPQHLRNPAEDRTFSQPNSETILAYQPAVSDPPLVRPSFGTPWADTATEEDRLRWMHRLSIAVDHSVSGNPHLIGSRFQALLALHHGQPCLEGLFLALETRLVETAMLDLESRVARLRDFMEAAVLLFAKCQAGRGESQ